MPDITAELLDHNPLFDPLPPMIDDLLEYEEVLDYEGNHITFEWAHNEIQNHLTGFVRAGLVAGRMRLYRLYRDTCKSFQEYCERILGKSHWQIKRLIDAARVVVELAKEGFTTLPTCESQCRPLTKFKGAELFDKWESVIKSIPPHRITASAIDEVLNVAKPKKVRVGLDPELYKRLAQRALDMGLSVEELLEQLLDGEEPDETPEPEESEENAPTTSSTSSTLERWDEDLEQLTREYMNTNIDRGVDSS